MKKNVLLLAISFVCIGGMAQDKLFKEALSAGAGPDGFYTINNTSNRYSIDDFKKVANKNNYLLDPNYGKKDVNRFGDISTLITTVRFIPESEYTSYIYYVLSQGGGISFNNLKYYDNVYVFPYYYNTKDKTHYYFYEYNDVYWSGGFNGNMITGRGSGLAYNDKWYVAFTGTFYNGYPSGRVTFRWLPTSKLKNVIINNSDILTMPSVSGSFHDDMAWFEVNGVYGFVDAASRIIIKPQYKQVVDDFLDNPSGVNYAVIHHTDGYDWKMNRSGTLFAYSDAQQKKFDDEAAAKEKARIEAEIKAEEERRIAEEKAAEERRIAEEKEAALLKLIEKNKNTKLWTRGCRLCYRYPGGKEYILATLEEWNETRTKVKVKIVASPSSTKTLNGELLTKNNTMWVSTTNEGWHLALDEEIEIALNNDNSVRTVTVSSSSSSSSSSNSYKPSYSDCSTCHGTGYVTCYTCDGSGRYDSSSWGEDEEYRTCSSCNGTGRRRCSSCNGTGRR